MTTALDLRSTPSYRHLLTTPHVLRLLVGAVVGHLPVAMAPLALLLAVRADGGTVSQAGLLAAAYGVSAALGQPWWGRMLDRHGHLPTLLATAVVSAGAFTALAALSTADHPVAAVLLTLTAGLATPPLEAALRVLWPTLTATGPQLRAALSLDASAQEVVFIAGPLLVLVCNATTGAAAALGAAALLGLVGALAFATAPPSRRWLPIPPRRVDWMGPLRVRGPRILAFALIGAGIALGTLNVVALALAEHHHVPAVSTLVQAALAVGSLTGGLLFGRLRLPGSSTGHLRGTAIGMTVGLVPFLLTPGPVIAVAAAVLPGLFLAPLLISVFASLEHLAPNGTLGEASAWMIAALGLGQAAGAGLGAAVADSGPLLPAVTALAGAALAVAPLLLGRRALAGAPVPLPQPDENRPVPVS
ncbi:MFS transporter [Streptomyces sp. HK10]|uniref:MFS transporter n=1 Tax=Streptomyces sp. HK10 TaxID=3373255 RepID=UPI00374A5010